METKEYINTYRTLQDCGLLDMPCPRCGGKMDKDDVENPISWYAGLSVCSTCGSREALESNAGELRDWYAVHLLKNRGSLLNKFSPNDKTAYYTLPIFEPVHITDREIDILVAMALEGAVSKWCSIAEPLGEQLGKEPCQQIAMGGVIRLRDRRNEQDYELTLEKFLKGLRTYLQGHMDKVYENGIDTGELEGLDVDSIIQLAIFGEVLYD